MARIGRTRVRPVNHLSALPTPPVSVISPLRFALAVPHLLQTAHQQISPGLIE
jgi:hypothetical protein